jgi:hypothetical protein
MNYEEFFDEASRLSVALNDDSSKGTHAVALSNEALFQIPLLAMTILAFAKGQKKPHLSQVGQLVGECLERSITGFKGSTQGIGWSANLRIRTVRALTFLEVSGLVSLSRTKLISTTDQGKKLIDEAFRLDGRLSIALKTIERAYQNISSESQFRMKIE